MSTSYDLVCFSHLRWDYVYQRPQHLMSRCAAERRVFFVEEPEYVTGQSEPSLETRRDGRVTICTPQLPAGTSEAAALELQRSLVDELIESAFIDQVVLWYWTPMALPFTRHLKRIATIYDCMDELAGFKGAHSAIAKLEPELLKSADIVFTGGHSLYEVKRHWNDNTYSVPSSVDREHFASARLPGADPEDQARIPTPRAGFYGVIDERMDMALLAGLADARPELQIVLVGPIAKIDPSAIPARANVHWLGPKTYDELPHYLRGWDVALLPFARNASTRFISPTKTPEYLAAGKPVVSTSIRDVVSPYAELHLARIADHPIEFAEAVDAALREDANERLARAESFLARTSWDRTWATMAKKIALRVGARVGRTANPAFAQAGEK